MASINETLGTLPSGRVIRLSDDQLTKHLFSVMDSQSNQNRRRKARLRLDLFKDRGEAQIEAMIDDQFKNQVVRALRKKFVEIASFQNITKRIIREISSVYSEPAKRIVSSRNEVYRQLQAGLSLDRMMRQMNQRLNLLNDVVLWFDVSLGIPRVRVITPDNFTAIAHPLDPTLLVALVIDQVPAGDAATDTSPHFLVVTNEEFFNLDRGGRLVSGSRFLHGLPRMPMILAHRVPPETTLLDPDPGSDIIAAHKAIALVNVMFLKHQKSGTKQGVISGDFGDMPHGQPMDEEHLLQAPEGASLSTLDLGANPSSYIDSVRAIIKQIAANYGIPESVFDLSYQATSGFEIELKRTGLREVRRDQIVDFRPIEREFAEIMSLVLTESRSPFAFSTAGWSIDFGEMEAPQDPIQRLNYWRELRRMGLMNTVEMYQDLNPEATAEEALKAIRRNAEIEAERIELFRSLNFTPDMSSDESGSNTGANAPGNGGQQEEEDDGDS